eukprot:scaffold9028_cov298-Chaetoceros_neogracile.AAC.4
MVEGTASPNICCSSSATTPVVISNHKKSWPNDLPLWNLIVGVMDGKEGSDLVHSISSPVRILEYKVRFCKPSHVKNMQKRLIKRIKRHSLCNSAHGTPWRCCG